VRGEKWSFDFELLGWLEESGRGMDRIEDEIEVLEIFQERKRKRIHENSRFSFRSRVFLWTGGCDQGFF
jgi:hypothetical protein